MRHGIAEDPAPGQPDATRALTPEGEEQMVRVAQGLASLGFRPDAILSSPLVRAEQTARYVGEALGVEVQLVTAIGMGFQLSDLQDATSAFEHGDTLLLVGHEPSMSWLVGHLMGGGNVRMKKASVACLEVSRVQLGGGELKWLMTARQLARLGDGV